MALRLRHLLGLLLVSTLGALLSSAAPTDLIHGGSTPPKRYPCIFRAEISQQCPPASNGSLPKNPYEWLTLLTIPYVQSPDDDIIFKPNDGKPFRISDSAYQIPLPEYGLMTAMWPQSIDNQFVHYTYNNCSWAAENTLRGGECGACKYESWTAQPPYCDGKTPGPQMRTNIMECGFWCQKTEEGNPN